jgi:hypothetical protein
MPVIPALRLRLRIMSLRPTGLHNKTLVRRKNLKKFSINNQR